MRVLVSWLKEYVNFDKTPEQLANDLSLFGHEVEEIEKIGEDYILDIEVTPNRGDCLSILGIARELAGLYKLPFNLKKIVISEEGFDKDIRIIVQKPDICSRFTARVIDNVNIQASPKWMKERLSAYGFRPINNIVDITNYVMIETGQPLHAFDYNKIETTDGKKVVRIRQSKAKEEVRTLDGREYILNKDAIVIEDDEKIYDLAGIMGGLNSEVGQSTKTVILQGAVFNPILIRKTSKSLNLVTEASYRFERGVDIQGTSYAVNLATMLISQTNPSAKAGRLKDVIAREYEPKKLKVSSMQINKLLGTKLHDDDIQKELKRLNFSSKKHNHQILVTVPSYREFDVNNWQDIAEEVARIKGYNNLPRYQLKKQKVRILDKQYLLSEFLKDLFVDCGYTEVYSYSFVDKKTLEILDIFSKGLIEIKNPLSPETRYLRPNLIPSLLMQIAKNPWAPTIKIFEIGNCFNADREFKQVAFAQSQDEKQDLEKFIEVVKKKLNIDKVDYEIVSIDKKVLNKLKIRKRVLITTINFETLLNTVKSLEYKIKLPSQSLMKIRYKPISKYAPTIKDLAFIVDKNANGQKIADEIESVDKRIRIVEFFDEFYSSNFGQNKKSLAFHIWLEDLKAPITETEAKEVLKKVVDVIYNKYHAELRGSIV